MFSSKFCFYWLYLSLCKYHYFTRTKYNKVICVNHLWKAPYLVLDKWWWQLIKMKLESIKMHVYKGFFMMWKNTCIYVSLCTNECKLHIRCILNYRKQYSEKAGRKWIRMLSTAAIGIFPLLPFTDSHFLAWTYLTLIKRKKQQYRQGKNQN